MDIESLWERTCALLVRDMNYVSYTTWVDGNMYPVKLEDDRLLICVKMEQMIGTLDKKYGPLIGKRLSEAAGKPMLARLITRRELEEMEGNGAGNGGTPAGDPRLNPKYTFESFVVGSGNRFAHAAALAVAESPAEAYNPLFIYGGVGLGKTHLMQAIGHFIHENDPGKRILYMTSESFTNELISAIQTKKTYEFREKIRKVDVLMVDDIQFIAGRESTQQEFFNTFNELHNANKQIVLTSDKPPKDIQRLEERLCSRFEWGLVADIQRPDVDTRVAILREKTQQEGITVPDDVLQLIAGKIDSNIRELEGCLTRLVAYSSLIREPITQELCEKALKEIFDQKKQKQVTAELIMQTVSDYYGLTIGELTGPTRKREITVPRQIAMYLTREMTGMSLPQIGSVFGGRDHTTVMHSCKIVEANMAANANIGMVVEDVKRLVREAQ
ncbi:MAG: chromosomal replication initiator protein DnaA [Clostridia bacterium]|nr:chromosomal replication initiator protein DnaA [Clostridia bacterium]